MRAFVFLLILANLLFLAWTQGYLGASSDPDTLRVQQQLLADQVKVVARDEFPAEPGKAEKVVTQDEKKETEVCLSMNELPVAEVARVEGLLADKWVAFKAVRTVVEASASYWVYIPPLESKAEVDKKTAELKKLNVPEFYVVQESGPNNRAISLGLFSSKEAATARLDVLRAKGIKSAKVAERNGKPTSVSLDIHGPEAQADALRLALADLLPESKPVACKAAATPAQ